MWDSKTPQSASFISLFFNIKQVTKNLCPNQPNNIWQYNIKSQFYKHFVSLFMLYMSMGKTTTPPVIRMGFNATSALVDALNKQVALEVRLPPPRLSFKSPLLTAPLRPVGQLTIHLYLSLNLVANLIQCQILIGANTTFLSILRYQPLK